MNEENKNISKCKTCGGMVAKTASSCPHCGEKNPVEMPKGCLYAILIFIITLMVIGAFSGNDTPEKQGISDVSVEQTTDSQHIGSRVLPLTLDEFVDRYNTALNTIGAGDNVLFSAVIEKENDNGDKITALVRTNSIFGAVLTADNKTRRVKSISFSGPIGATEESMATSIAGAIAVVMALENPTMDRDARTDVFKNITSGGLSKDPNVMLRSGVTYSVTVQNPTRLNLFAVPAY